MPKKLEDCVKDVMAQGKPESNAYAICVSSTGLSPHEKSASSDIPESKLPKMIVEHKQLVNVLESPSHEDDKDEAKKQKKELEEYQNQMNKSDWPIVVNSNAKNVDPVNLETHLMAKEDNSISGFLEVLNNQVNNLDRFDVVDFKIPSKDGEYSVSIFKREPNLYSGILRDPEGIIIQEFNNQTLEIMASIMSVKMGQNQTLQVIDHLIPEEIIFPDETKPEILEKDEGGMEMGGSVPTPASGIMDSPEMLGDTIAFNPQEKNQLEPLEKDKESESEGVKKEIRLTNDGHIIITLFKSLKGDKDSMKPTVKKPMDQNKPNPMEQEQEPNMEMEQDESEETPILDSVVDDDDASNDPQEEGVELDDENNEDYDDDVLTEVSDENPEGITEPDASDMMGQQDPNGMMNDENHEYVKMSTHDGGKQYWYRDKNTGKIIEKPNAPEGHPDFDNGTMLADLSQKVDMLIEKIEQLSGQDLDMDNEAGEAHPMGDENALNGQNDMNALNDEDNMDESSGEAQANPEMPIQNKQKFGSDKAQPKDNKQPNSQAAKPKAEAGDKKQSNGNSEKKPAPKKDDKKAKMLKSLAAKFPGVSEDKLLAALEKAEKVETQEFGSAEVKPLKMDSIKETDGGEQETAPFKTANELHQAETAGNDGEPANKKTKIKKSRFERMWKVFNIDMPDNLTSTYSVIKANEGLAKLQKCILKQGKSEAEANRIVNRAIIEKYDLLNKGSANFKDYQSWLGGQTIKDVIDPRNPQEMESLRKSDADKRFSVREYTENNTSLAIEKSTDINNKVSEMMNPQAPKWDFKEYQEPVNKSEPSDFQKSRQSFQDERWNVKEFKETGDSTKNLTITKSTSINDRIKKSDEDSQKNSDFSNRYKEYSEDKTKLQKSAKTESELLNEKIEKNNWSVKPRRE